MCRAAIVAQNGRVSQQSDVELVPGFDAADPAGPETAPDAPDLRGRSVVLRAGGLAAVPVVATGWFGRLSAMTAGVVAAAGVVVAAAAWSVAGSVGDTPPQPLWIAPPAAVADIRAQSATPSASATAVPGSTTPSASGLHLARHIGRAAGTGTCRAGSGEHLGTQRRRQLRVRQRIERRRHSR